jgi:hypothetical protein
MWTGLRRARHPSARPAPRVSLSEVHPRSRRAAPTCSPPPPSFLFLLAPRTPQEQHHRSLLLLPPLCLPPSSVSASPFSLTHCLLTCPFYITQLLCSPPPPCLACSSTTPPSLSPPLPRLLPLRIPNSPLTPPRCTSHPKTLAPRRAPPTHGLPRAPRRRRLRLGRLRPGPRRAVLL